MFFIRKTVEKNNVTIALNVWYAKRKRFMLLMFPKHSSNREKQVILLTLVSVMG